MLVSVLTQHQAERIEGIFDTLQGGLSKLGENAKSQSNAAGSLVYLIKDIPMEGKQDYDVL